jgi:hypothetical protein
MATGFPARSLPPPAACDYLSTTGTGTPADRERARDALLVLERTGLLDIDPSGTPPLVRMSPVIQASVRAAMPTVMRDRAVRAAADGLLQAWPRDDQQSWLAGSLRSCAASLQQTAGDLLWSGACHPLLMRAGQSLDQARLTSPAEAYWRDLVAAAETALGPNHPDTQLATGRLAEAYLAAGRAGEAIAWFERMVSGRVRPSGPSASPAEQVPHGVHTGLTGRLPVQAAGPGSRPRQKSPAR